MQLRELYHNGEHSIPPVFLIEEPSPSQSKNLGGNLLTAFNILQSFLETENEESSPTLSLEWVGKRSLWRWLRAFFRWRTCHRIRQYGDKENLSIYRIGLHWDFQTLGEQTIAWILEVRCEKQGYSCFRVGTVL